MDKAVRQTLGPYLDDAALSPEDGVGKHLTAIFAKLGVSSRAEAVAIALRKHLLKI